MTWQQLAVKAWREWQAQPGHDAKIIPPYEQVGRILEFCLCKETEVVEFINRQVEADKGTAMFKSAMSDDYWPSVKKTFYEIQVNQIMMAD